MGVQLAQLHLSPHSAAAAPQPASAAYCFSSAPSSCPSSHFTRSIIFSASCRSPFISGCGYYCSSLRRTRYTEHLKSRRTNDRIWATNGKGRRRSRRDVTRAILDDDCDSGCSENYDDDEVFLRRLQEMATSCGREQEFAKLEREAAENDAEALSFSSARPSSDKEPPLLGLVPPEPSWRDEVVPVSVEIRANSVELPLSLRIIKQKKRWEEQLISSITEAACESGSSSVKKAFSSMVFMIRELQSCTVQMRESLVQRFCKEDLQSILHRVHQELHASFVWLFQHIFSSTPALMLSVMLLLANFTVHSMANSPAIAAPISTPSASSISEVAQIKEQQNKKLDFSTVKTFSFGKTASVNGGSGGGGKVKPVAGATDDGRSSVSSYSTVIPDGSSSTTSRQSEIVNGQEEEEEVVWKRIVDEAKSMQAGSRSKPLMGSETLKRLVAPVHADVEPDNPVDYLNTELWYQHALSQDPNNTLILANFAQFIYTVLRDIARAEEYFKRAVGIEPRDAEALSKYASFLWVAKKNVAAAEETYLEAIAADPGNAYYSASYANFLWNTGGEDTCFPIY